MSRKPLAASIVIASIHSNAASCPFRICSKLLSRTIRADFIAVHLGADRHRAVRIEVVPLAVDLLPTAGEHLAVIVQPVPFLVVGEPTFHRLSVFVVTPFAAVILPPAVCGLRVDDDLHKPV